MRSFHLETLETASKEIDLKGVTVAVGRTEVIADSHLRLKNGVKYALMGRSVRHSFPASSSERYKS